MVLEKAWRWRAGVKLEAYRVFHGPGEGEAEWAKLAVDRFLDHFILTHWSEQSLDLKLKHQIMEFYRPHAQSMVYLRKPKNPLHAEWVEWWGKPPEALVVSEEGRKFWVHFDPAERHVGLFLDHLLLRNFLQRLPVRKVLNAFAYTGSLGIAASLGGAQEVVQLDLSRRSLDWAKKNQVLNGLSGHEFWAGDYFDTLARFRRQQVKFDLVILDPPSFFHAAGGKKYSLERDLCLIHEAALSVLEEEGFLVTCLNTAKFTRAQFLAELFKLDRSFQVVHEIQLPPTFPIPLGAEAYLKGWVLKVSQRKTLREIKERQPRLMNRMGKFQKKRM